ncbi:DNA starvation/stationary phase protection protein [Lacihabitans sp. LS3-19]|uniref:Dps family protein n=1 Tax=Lacihabitans sp. LS3-19 TaxID=2487335 RepID=UPI0020CC65DD|nr:DNA starvation/stationary phase protection protein [Lacihabitans sp. LS3-19]MCP9767037.1 DNA starvation/stationary phase protection protein [Lacihabitans sp. LS3-19]
MEPEIGINKKHLNATVKLLEVILSDEVILYTKTRKFHWNVTGESFMELHRLFKTQYIELEETIDLVAERIAKLGNKVIGTMKEFSDLTRLKEHPNAYPEQKELLHELLSDYESVIKLIRKDIGICQEINHDAGTADFLTGLIEQHETTAWILRRYLE